MVFLNFSDTQQSILVLETEPGVYQEVIDAQEQIQVNNANQLIAVDVPSN